MLLQLVCFSTSEFSIYRSGPNLIQDQRILDLANHRSEYHW